MILPGFGFSRGSVARGAGAVGRGDGASAVLSAVMSAVLAQASCTFAHPVQRAVGAPPPELGGESVTFPSASGAMVHAWFSAGRPDAGAVLVLHGVGANRLAMRARARFLHQAGYTVLVPDLQAHGETRGAHITFGALESRDAAAALVYLRTRVPEERVGVIGISMGGAATLVGASPLNADAFVLESVYPTLEDAVRDRLRAWLGPLRALAGASSGLLLRVVGDEIDVQPRELRPIDRIAAVTAPILLIAGSADRYTPLAESRALYARACAPKSFWAVPGAVHEDLHAYAPVEYERRVGGFLAARLRHVPGEVAHATSRTACCEPAPGEAAGPPRCG